MIGFFDGDGCVTTHGRNPKLCISQSYTSGEVLLLFNRAFGGGIYRNGVGKGLQVTAIQWELKSGDAVRSAAAQLAQLPSLKQDQLLMAADWPRYAQEQRIRKAMLRSLKDTESYCSVHCSWGYLAGFLDAEGCISIAAKSCSVILRWSQKRKHVLTQMKKFLDNQSIGLHAHTYGNDSTGWVLVMANLQACQTALREMMAAGLLNKRPSAEVALALSSSNHGQLRSELRKLSGNQSMRRHLDTDGCQRSREIRRLSMSLRRLQLSDQVEAALEVGARLADLKAQHSLLNKQSEIATLRAHVRNLLKAGATVSPRQAARDMEHNRCA
ncbi:unnamed protein product [Polarella glacialis]|uniref:Homing endonuclease LAGLIDADG domain-containing protein n=1 Tax=Polarella glacialis TaxID=89957 RepID=A0A813H6I9_POLGL|nr:unnamed protein product [Polarella glacialis]